VSDAARRVLTINLWALTSRGSSSSIVFEPYPESKDQILAALSLGEMSFGESIVATCRNCRQSIVVALCFLGEAVAEHWDRYQTARNDAYIFGFARYVRYTLLTVLR
jgi:hypothetical protein